MADKSYTAERAVLGICLLKGRPALTQVLEAGITDRDISMGHHNSAIFGAMLALDKTGEDIDEVTVSAKLNGKVPYENLASLSDAAPTSAHLASYIAQVRDSSIRRHVGTICARTQEYLREGELDGEDLIADLQAALADLCARSIAPSRVRLREALDDAISAAHKRHESGEKQHGIPTGLIDLDRLLGGFTPTELVLLAARPSIGKSSLAGKLAVAAAVAGYPTLFVSLEMSQRLIVERVICSEAQVALSPFRQGETGSTDWRKVNDTVARLYDIPLWLDDRSNTTLAQIVAGARQFAMDEEVRDKEKLIVIDYVQLIRSGLSKRSRENEVAEISGALKQLARDCNAAVIGLAQLNRDVEKRENKRPMLSDLRESGALEQDADVVMMLYREDYYKKETDRQGIAELIVSKNRNGSTGECELSWMASAGRFDNHTEREYEHSY